MKFATTSPVDFLSDPLSEVTRKERRNLLIAGTANILVLKMDLVPSKISTLGVELQLPAQDIFLVSFSIVVFYLICAFCLYGVADFLVWRKKYQDYLEAVRIENLDWTEHDQQEYDELHEDLPRIHWVYRWSSPVAFARIIFEFVLPVLVGCYAIYLQMF